MEDFISFSVSSFIHFLSGKESYIKSIKSDKILISFAVQLDNFLYREKLNSLLDSNSISILFEHPSENFSFFGLNTALNFSHDGSNRFSLTEIELSDWKKSFVNNWDSLPFQKFPLFTGAMKFTPDDNKNLWKDFEDSYWFVPEVILSNINSNTFLIFNFVLSKSGERDLYREKYKIALVNLFSKEFPPENNHSHVDICLNSHDDEKLKWDRLVKTGLQNISENKIQKVVFSRKLSFNLSDLPPMNPLINSLNKNYPECYIFLLQKGNSFFFGATPEKLIKFFNGRVEIDALAGSAPRGNSTEEDECIGKNLLLDNKNLHEHNLLVDEVIITLNKFTDNIRREKTSLKKLANIQHLSTKLFAEIGDGSVFPLISELYPTPAICGLPKAAALELINKHEGYSRGLYSGIIGWLNFNNEGEFVVALRSALITDDTLNVFAGSGIVKDSVPSEEYAETNLKLKPILYLFTNEN